MRAVCRQMEKGSQGTFQLWDRTYHFSKLLLASVFAWGNSLAPNNPLWVPGLAVLFGCWSVTSQQLKNCYKAAIPEATLLRDEWIYLSFLHYCQKSTGLMHEICSVLMLMIRSKRNLCQYFTLLSKKNQWKCFLVNSMFDMWPVSRGIGKADKYPVPILQRFPGKQTAWGREGAVQLCNALCLCPQHCRDAASLDTPILLLPPVPSLLPLFTSAKGTLLSPSLTQRVLTHQGLFCRLVQALSAGLLHCHLFMILNVLSSPGNTPSLASFTYPSFTTWPGPSKALHPTNAIYHKTQRHLIAPLQMAPAAQISLQHWSSGSQQS